MCGDDISIELYTHIMPIILFSIVVDVAGIAAAIRSANPSWNPAQVRGTIVKSAVTLPSSGISLARVDDISCPRPPTSAPTLCSNGMDVEIQIKTDYFPMETAWTLTNKCIEPETVIKSPKYTKYVTMHSTSMLCLPAGQYEFTITDKLGDGNCCHYGDGSYAIVVDGSTVRSGGVFEFFETTMIGSAEACAMASQQGSIQTPIPSPAPPTSYPTVEPTTRQPSTRPPTIHPTTRRTASPTTHRRTSRAPTRKPTTRIPSSLPTRRPTTKAPTRSPTRIPISRAPTRKPILR